MGILGNRVVNGTFAEVWIDGVLVAGETGFNAKTEKQKTDVQMCGQMAVDSKTTATKGKLSLSMYHIYTLLREDAVAIAQGIEKRHTVVGKLKDPDAYGAERVAFYNVSFDDHTFFDATAGRVCTRTLSGTYTEAEYMEASDPQ